MISNTSPDDATISGTNGVDGTTDQGLKVVIAGGGIGGLTAAIALRRQGHHVYVYEQSRFANEIGAAIHMTPNAMGVLKHIGIDPRDSGAVPLIQPWVLAHRAHFHTQLKQAAVSKDGEGEPVKIHTSSPVVSADPNTATVTLADGSSHSADVVIGADGVHSRTREGIIAPPPKTFKTHASAFRFTIERELALEDPETRALADANGSMEMWYLSDRKIVLYPTSHNMLLNFACIHPGALSDTTDSYDKSASKATLLEVYKEFHPRILRLLSKVDPAELKVYPLFDMHTLPTFVSGRLALIGDAAHPFTPHLAQGGAMAIEDGVSLGVMLDKTVTPAEVPERVQLYNKARYERASTIQDYSRQVGGDGTDADDDAKKVAAFKVHEYMEYGLSHDEVHSSTRLLRLHRWQKHARVVRWRQPTVFGPLPEPRQDASGNPYTESLRQSTKTSMTIQFKTSATLLRNLFPNNRYYFEKSDTVAKASFSLDSLRNMAWLGGGGYDLLALYIHGVCYRETGGKVRKGTYCPAMFENLADPILTGREELGIPKMFSDIEIRRDATFCQAKVSWRGAYWATLECKDLQMVEKDPNEIDGGEGLLVHKYVPSTEIGKPDADYDILHPRSQMAGVQSIRAAGPDDVRLVIDDLGPKLLPTLHPVISRLAELPILEILGGAVSECQGVPDFSSIERLS